MSAQARFEPTLDLHVVEIGDEGGERVVVLSYRIAAPAPSGCCALTPAEADVAALASAGLSNADIAARRGAAVRTVANQVATVLRKLGVGSRRELAAHWNRHASA